MNCSYNCLYRNCAHCGRSMHRLELRECTVEAAPDRRTEVLAEVRTLIVDHAKRNWNVGLIERSDGITELLVEFDQKFPEVRQS